MNWLIANYVFTAPFSLKNSLATSSGGKTNLVPTMFSIKMALIDASFRIGLDGEKEFEWIKSLRIRLKPPKKAVVQNSFVKIQKESRKEILKENPDQCFTSTVGLREYVIFDGDLSIAIKIEDLNDSQIEVLQKLLTHINQLGKRGCFVQLKQMDKLEEVSGPFTFTLDDSEITLPHSLTVQYLDDMGDKARFPSINSFDETKSTIGKDRLFIPVGLPYQLTKSSRGFTLYERIDV